MKINSRYFILSLYLFFLSCSSFAQNNTGAANDILPATSLRPFGRSLIDQQQNLELISSAVHFGFSFSGKECAVYAFINDANGHNYLQYELDGVYQKRLKIIGDSVQQSLLKTNIDDVATVDFPQGAIDIDTQKDFDELLDRQKHIL